MPRLAATVAPAAVALVVLAVLALAAAAPALREPGERPVRFAPGDDAGPGRVHRYVPEYRLSEDRTRLAAAVLGVAEAELVIESFARIENVEPKDRTVTLAAPTVANPRVAAYRIEVLDGAGAVLSVLDFRGPAPSASAPIAYGAHVTLRLVLALASGAGADDAATSSAMTLSVV